MGFTVPDKKKSVKQNMFPIHGLKKEYEIPLAQYLPGRIVEKLQGQATESIFVVLDEITPGLGEELRDYPLMATTDLIQAWQKASSVTVGE